MKTGIRQTVVGAAAALVVGAQVFLAAQVSLRNGAKHVRIVPVQSARQVGSPILNGIGSFSPAPTSQAFTIQGIVQDHRGTVVPNAGMVNVRDLLTGRVVARSAVNELAQFGARGLRPGVYTAELINGGGSVLASTPAFTGGVGEILQIAQTIFGAPAQGLGGVLGAATTSALQAAAGSGVLAVAAGAPVSPGS